MKGYPDLMRQLGVDPVPLIEKHQLPADLGDCEEGMVALSSAVRLMEDSVLAACCPDIGLRLAACQDIGILGPLAAAVQHSESVREALATISRYLYVQNPALQITVVEPSELIAGAVEIRLEMFLPQVPICRQSFDHCLGVLHHSLQLIAGSRYNILAVAVPHKPVADARAYTGFFGAPLRVEQEHGGLHIAPETLGGKLTSVNSIVRKLALDYLERTYGDSSLSFTERVRRALSSTLGSIGGGKSAVADLLFLHPRTLQRKLAAEGAKFEDIRDEVRRHVAEHYLKESSIPLAQLTILLGLSDQSVLTRCCTRWFGMTPSKIRAAVTL
ncbi:AraC family transcriptional regulator ligand-binding domain-containing protein [Pseudomonas vranovensis]|uniref:AraC family transcriptional regulator n=1 Tax=Pseudomonas vranovensis TaxID=321661 RepID=UPI003D952A8B